MSSVFCFHWSIPSGPCSGKFLKSRMLCSGCRMLCLTFIIACSAHNAVSIPSLSIACPASHGCSCTAPRTMCIYIRIVSQTGLLPLVLRRAGRLFFANLWLCRSPSNLWSLEPCPRRATCCSRYLSCPTPWQGSQTPCFGIRSGFHSAWPIGSSAFWV